MTKRDTNYVDDIIQVKLKYKDPAGKLNIVKVTYSFLSDNILNVIYVIN